MKDFNELVKIIKTLRGENGCNWDKVQTPESLILYLKKEVKELSIGIKKMDKENIAEEIGDIMMIIIMIITIYEERGILSVKEVLRKSIEKIIRRHPHVFLEKRNLNQQEVIKQWRKIKRTEKNL